MQIVFEFFRGPRDGERSTGLLEDGLLSEAVSLYGHTKCAPVGARFWCTCEYAVHALRSLPWTDIEQLEQAGYRFRGHVYEIVERREEEDSITVRARHVYASE